MTHAPALLSRSLAARRLSDPWCWAAALACLWWWLAQPVVERLDLAVHDLLSGTVASALAGPSVRADSIVVAIDDNSLQALGPWPWPRQRHADLIDVLRQAGTQAVGYHVLFSEPAADPADDARLAAAIASHGQIILPVRPAPGLDDGPSGVQQPLSTFAKAAAALGHAETPIDRDGQVRRVALVAGSGTTVWEALPLAVQRVSAPRASTSATTAPQATAADHWWHDKLQLLPAAARPVPEISAASLLRDPALALQLTGRVVWVGLTARSLDSTVAVASPHGSTTLSEVQWQAQIHQAMDGRRLVEIASAPVVLVANVLPLLLALVVRRALEPLRFPRVSRHWYWLLPLPFVLLVQSVALIGLQYWLPLGAMVLGVTTAWLLYQAMALRASHQAQRRALDLARTTLQSLTDAVLTLDASHRVRYLNPPAERLAHRPVTGAGLEAAPAVDELLQLTEHDTVLLLQAVRDCQAQRRTVEVEAPLKLQTPDGDRQVRAIVHPMSGETETAPGVVLLLTDLTAALRVEPAPVPTGTHDTLTGLPNRILLTDLLAHALAHGRHQHQALAVLFIDLDQFGRINDSLGQRQGDEVLEVVAARLRRVFRPHDTIARWGNDQFVVLIEDVTSREVVAALAAQLIDVVSRGLRVDEVEITCSCSVGIALSPDDAPTPDALLSMSEAAMSRAKSAGGGRFEFYTASMSTLTRDWLALENRLRHALEAGEFVLHYQIQTDLRSGRPVGLEALLRWRQDDGELWAPARFLSITEETGLIVAVGNWVIREATQQVRRWIDAGVTPLPVSVNVSARQCMDAHLFEVIAEALQDAEVAPSLLKMEITESTAMADLDHLRDLLLRLRQLGVGIALDDFGTGFSSLAHLKRFPVDQIKIDPSFIADIHRDPNGAAIVRATIALAHGLGVPVVAEGVENEAQIRFLREHHCDIVQGYLYGRPGSPDAIREVLTSADVHPRYLHPESHS